MCVLGLGQMNDFWAHSNFEAWEEHVKEVLIPMLEGTAVSITLVPQGTGSIRFAVELGLSIMLDKPIIALVRPGSSIPAALARAADELVEVDIKKDPDAAQRSISAAYARVMRSRLGHVPLENMEDETDGDN